MERPRYESWAPSNGKPSAPILGALRAAGFLAQIGCRRVPAGNFEVRFLGDEEERVRGIIFGVDPGARVLTVGR